MHFVLKSSQVHTLSTTRKAKKAVKGKEQRRPCLDFPPVNKLVFLAFIEPAGDLVVGFANEPVGGFAVFRLSQ